MTARLRNVYLEQRIHRITISAAGAGRFKGVYVRCTNEDTLLVSQDKGTETEKIQAFYHCINVPEPSAFSYVAPRALSFAQNCPISGNSAQVQLAQVVSAGCVEWLFCNLRIFHNANRCGRVGCSCEHIRFSFR